MTIGQRIAERRKLLGISQEALGEQMGVSRQAISKWEADGAIPEIDKLIALSKLFGVSVGWLLGTESEDSPKQETGLSEEQLITMEKIVQKYQQPQRKSLLMLVCLACAVAALILSVIGLGKTPAKLNDLSLRLAQLEGEPLLSDYSAEFTALPDWKKAQVAFQAAPKNWQEGDTAYLILREGDSERYQIPCAWNGEVFLGEGDITYGKYEAYFVICHVDGSQEQQNTSEAFYGLPYELRSVCDVEVVEYDGFWNDIETLNALVVRVEPPWIMAQEEGLVWAKLDLVLYHNEREYVVADLLKSCVNTLESDQEASDTNEGIQSETRVKGLCMRLELREPLELSLPEFQNGDFIHYCIKGKLSNGYTFTQPLGALFL